MSHHVHECPDMAATGKYCKRCQHIHDMVESWPPLTAEQIDKLRLLLPPPKC